MRYVESWMETTIPYGTERTKEDLIVSINYRNGYALGLAMKINDLEEKLAEAEQKFDLARQYQREVDAQLVESLISPLRSMEATLKNEALTVAAKNIREF